LAYGQEKPSGVAYHYPVCKKAFWGQGPIADGAYSAGGALHRRVHRSIGYRIAARIVWYLRRNRQKF